MSDDDYTCPECGEEGFEHLRRLIEHRTHEHDKYLVDQLREEMEKPAEEEVRDP